MNIEIQHNPAPPPPPPTVHLELTLEEFAVIRALSYRHLSVRDKRGASLYNDLKEMDAELGIGPLKAGTLDDYAVTSYREGLLICGLTS